MLLGCNYGKDYDLLNESEAIINEHPDSALTMLQSIEANSLYSASLKARYSLLLSKALDKNDINITSDSLIRPAVDYYSTSDDAYRYFQSLFYLGRVYDNAGNSVKAIVTYSQAEKLIPEFDDDYIKGQLYLETGLIYNKHLDFIKANVDFGKAVNYFKKAGKQLHMDYSLYSQASALHTMGDFNTSLKKYDECIASYGRSGNISMIGSCLASKLILFVELEDTNRAFITYNEMLKYCKIDTLPSSLLSVIAKMYALLGDKTKSYYYLDKAEQLLKTSKDTVVLYNESAFVNARFNNYQKAYDDLDKSYETERKIIINNLSQPLVTAQRDAITKELKQQSEAAKHRTYIYTMIILIGCVLFIVIIIGIIRHRNAKLNMYAGIVDDLQISLENSKGILAKLFHDQFRFVNDIGRLMLDYENDSRGHKVIYKNVNELVSKFSNDKRTLEGLERMINDYFDNASQKFRTQFTELNENDYRRFCYHTAGFSGKLIALFLDETTANMYKRKSRLKERIANSTAVDKELFLHCLK